jgi:hypothetical protein
MGFGSSRHADTNGNGDAYPNCYLHCHCYAYTHSDISYPDGHTDCYSYSYGDGHCDSHTNGNSDSNRNVYIHTELDPATYTFAKAPPAGKKSANAAASSLAGRDWREMSQGRERRCEEQ